MGWKWVMYVSYSFDLYFLTSALEIGLLFFKVIMQECVLSFIFCPLMYFISLSKAFKWNFKAILGMR